jgi:hypothetical protein
MKAAPASLPRQAAVANLQKQQEEPQVTTQQYQQASEHFLAQARQELADGDLPQASEKGWGATAQILKAIAEQRGWEHSRHRHHLVTASRLRSETGDGDIRRLFAVASVLHENFYENVLPPDEIAENLDDVQALLSKLKPLLDAT